MFTRKGYATSVSGKTANGCPVRSAKPPDNMNFRYISPSADGETLRGFANKGPSRWDGPFALWENSDGDTGEVKDGGDVLLRADCHDVDAIAQMLVFDLCDHFRCHLHAELHRKTLDDLCLALFGSGSQAVPRSSALAAMRTTVFFCPLFI